MSLSRIDVVVPPTPSTLRRSDAEATWVLLSGEYPPATGGVADYSCAVATALARLGHRVHVFAPAAPGEVINEPGIVRHTRSSRYSLSGLRDISRALSRLGETRILVQYVPHAFGLKGMNVPFCMWLALQSRRSGQHVITMFHEVAYPFRPGQPWRRDVMAVVQRVMARLVGAASEKIFVSVPAWKPLLHALGVRTNRMTELPIFSNLPLQPDPIRVRALREALAPGERILIGHFGTGQQMVCELLDAVVPSLLAPSSRHLLLVGRGSDACAVRLGQQHPGLRSRVSGTGELSAEDAAAHLGTCDLLLQVYPDGLSGRRTTLMAGLALGLPVVSNLGALSEEYWSSSESVALAASPDPHLIVEAAENVIGNAILRRRLAERARAMYSERFSLQRTVDRLLEGAVAPTGSDGASGAVATVAHL
jgi:glycosyltransferase involved in cell wall biosynthesis